MKGIPLSMEIFQLIDEAEMTESGHHHSAVLSGLMDLASPVADIISQKDRQLALGAV